MGNKNGRHNVSRAGVAGEDVWPTMTHDDLLSDHNFTKGLSKQEREIPSLSQIAESALILQSTSEEIVPPNQSPGPLGRLVFNGHELSDRLSFDQTNCMSGVAQLHNLKNPVKAKANCCGKLRHKKKEVSANIGISRKDHTLIKTNPRHYAFGDVFVSSHQPYLPSYSRWDSREKVLKLVKIHVEVFRSSNKTKIEEKSDKVIVFRTPTMRVRATVTIPPVPYGQMWTIGWMQSCYFMKFVNVYGDLGFSSWEFPQLNMGLLGVNDSDGQSYPFYGHESEIFQVVGPMSKEKTFVVSMSDSPASHVTLKLPSRVNQMQGISHGVDLTCIKRKQKFHSWLIAFNDITNECIELKCLQWELDIHIKIMPDQPLGERAELKEPEVQGYPTILSTIPKVPQVAKISPDANHAQMLVWRPHNSVEPPYERSVRIVVPPETRGRSPGERELRNPTVYQLAKECLNKEPRRQEDKEPRSV